MSRDEKGAGSGLGEAFMKKLGEVQGPGKSTVIKKTAVVKKPVATKTKTAVVKKPVAATSDLTFKVGMTAASVDVAALQAEAKQRSEQLFGSAAEYHANDMLIKELQSVHKIELTSRGAELEQRIEQKKQFDVRLAKQAQGVQQQFKVDLFIVRIDKAMPTSDQHIIAVFDEIVAMGRGRKAAKGESADVYFRDDQDVKHGIIHMKSVMPGREGTVSGADLRIYKSVKGMIYRLRQHKEKQVQIAADALKAKINEIKSQAGGDVWKFSDGMPGVYVLNFEPKFVNGKPVGMPGAVKLEVYAFLIKGDPKPKVGLRVLEGAGCLAPTWKAHEKHGYTMPLWYLEFYASYWKRSRNAKEEGKDEKSVAEFPPNIPEESREQIQSFLRKLNAAVIQAKEIARYKRQQDQSTTETKGAAEEFAEEPELSGVAA